MPIALEDVIRHRRSLHRIPEAGLAEFKTQAYILGFLRSLSLTRVKAMADTGVWALLTAQGGEGTLAFRADMDALSIPENTGHDFPSQHPGFMHACGHDGHMAALLAFAAWASENRHLLKYNLVFIFQPAEESVGGAKRMIQQGALADPKVDAVYGMHILPDIPKGYIGLSEGPVMAQTSEVDLIVEGVSAHGAMPHRGVDAVVAAAQLVNMLQTVITRQLDPYDRALITVGRLTAGHSRNILADQAVLECTIRTFSDEVYQAMKQRILAMMKGLEGAYGVKTHWKDHVLYPVVDNHPHTTGKVRHAAGADICLPIEPMMIAEDFSYYQRVVPGTFFFLGSREEGRDAPLHSDRFDFDESILMTALGVYQNLATGGSKHV